VFLHCHSTLLYRCQRNWLLTYVQGPSWCLVHTVGRPGRTARTVHPFATSAPHGSAQGRAPYTSEGTAGFCDRQIETMSKKLGSDGHLRSHMRHHGEHRPSCRLPINLAFMQPLIASHQKGNSCPPLLRDCHLRAAKPWEMGFATPSNRVRGAAKRELDGNALSNLLLSFIPHRPCWPPGTTNVCLPRVMVHSNF
jgi:hypothetical protein